MRRLRRQDRNATPTETPDTKEQEMKTDQRPPLNWDAVAPNIGLPCPSGQLDAEVTSLNELVDELVAQRKRRMGATAENG
jgi:hypothetical protein